MLVAEAWSTSLGLVKSPGRTLDQIASRPSLGAAAVSVVVTGLVWALLSLLLWRAGHAPSRVSLPLPRDSYYLAQAVLVVPTLVLGWLVLGGVSHLLARWAGGRGLARSMLACAGFSYALPLLVLFVLPDLVVYLGFGFGSLGKLVRVTGLLLVIVEWALVTRAIVAAHQLAGSRALPIALVALLAQAAVGGAILR